MGKESSAREDEVRPFSLFSSFPFISIMTRFRKRCSKCKKIFNDRNAFHVDIGRPDGLNHRCKPCHRDLAIIYARKVDAKLKEQVENHPFIVYLYEWIGDWIYIGCSGYLIKQRINGHMQDETSQCHEILKALGRPRVKVLGMFLKERDGAEERAKSFETLMIKALHTRRMLNKQDNPRRDKGMNDSLYGEYDEFIA